MSNGQTLTTTFPFVLARDQCPIPPRWFNHICCRLIILIFVGAAAFSSAAPVLTRAHAHNDYEHARPLLDALDQGFCSVEADIYLVDGQLLVAHNREDVQARRTLQSLYLDPLRERVRAGGGHVYPGFATNSACRKSLSPAEPEVEFTLLIDIKRDGEAVYRELRQVLAGYADMLTRFTSNSTVPGAITVILSGDRPIQLVAAESARLCAIDGKISELETNSSVHLFPLISESWRPTFAEFQPSGLSATDRARLKKLVAQTHAQGRRLRFWGTPDRLFVWRELYAEDVDLLNTDNLAGLATFLQSPLSAASQQ